MALSFAVSSARNKYRYLKFVFDLVKFDKINHKG